MAKKFAKNHPISHFDFREEISKIIHRSIGSEVLPADACFLCSPAGARSI